MPTKTPRTSSRPTLTSRLAALSPSTITSHFSTSPGPTLPLRSLAIEALQQSTRTLDLVELLFSTLSPEFPLSPLARGATSAPAGTSSGVNAVLESQILTLQQTNEGLAEIISAMEVYLAGERA